jgi:hypothetical protein
MKDHLKNAAETPGTDPNRTGPGISDIIRVLAASSCTNAVTEITGLYKKTTPGRIFLATAWL